MVGKPLLDNQTEGDRHQAAEEDRHQAAEGDRHQVVGRDRHQPVVDKQLLKDLEGDKLQAPAVVEDIHLSDQEDSPEDGQLVGAAAVTRRQ